MTTSPPLREPALRRLRALLSGETGSAAVPNAGVEGSVARAPVRPVEVRAGAWNPKDLARRIIRRGIAWYVDPVARSAAQEAAEDMYRRVSRELVHAGTVEDPRVLAINQELIKGEFRSLLRTLEDLGQAIAPAAGLPGASARMAELRERMNDLDRRTRRLQSAPPAGAANGGSADHAEPRPGAAAGPSRFDYVGFERRFRGDSETIVAIQRERYLELLRGHDPVLDIGCGRGELVGALGEAGITAFGIDLDADSVAEAVALGRDVRQGDALQVLRETEPRSLGAIVAFHVVEHLELEPLLEFLELAAQRLRPGGLFVAETPNPESLVVLGNSYILDPTHVRPLHPSLLVFLCERAGFRSVELRFFAPATAYQLPVVQGDALPKWVDQINASLTKLNNVLFGPQEYAVVAQTPSV